MAPQNRAAYIKEAKAATSIVDTAPYTPPGPDELVIRTRAVAINPADWMLQKLGILISDYPAILGCDAAGEVVEVHPSLAGEYAVGDRVIAQGGALLRKDGVYCYSTFQEHIVVRTPSVARIPAAVPFEHAVVLPLGILTASSCLFATGTLGLDWLPAGAKPASASSSSAGPPARPGAGKTLIIWGASSSVGACGVQLAVAAGYDVLGIASTRNHAMVKSLGASACFDQTTPALVDLLLAAVQGKTVVGAFNAINDMAIFDVLCEVLDRAASPPARKRIGTVIPLADQKASRGVEICPNHAITADFMTSPVMASIWRWLADAMQQGAIQYAPRPEVVGSGLADIQKAVDMLAAGVSAKKLVVTI